MSNSDVIDGTFGALLSVGHTESQARQAIDNAINTGKTFKSVADMIDAIYRENMAVPETAEPVVAAAADDTPDADPTEAERDLEEIREAYQALALDTLAEERQHLEYKAAKQKREASQGHLNDVIRRQLEDMPLFNQPRPSGNGEPASEPDDDWRALPIAALCDHGLSLATATKLAEARIRTLGQLADWTGGGKRLTEIPGVGAAKAEAIEAASVAFFEARNQAGGAEQADVEAGEADDAN